MLLKATHKLTTRWLATVIVALLFSGCSGGGSSQSVDTSQGSFSTQPPASGIENATILFSDEPSLNAEITFAVQQSGDDTRRFF